MLTLWLRGLMRFLSLYHVSLARSAFMARITDGDVLQFSTDKALMIAG